MKTLKVNDLLIVELKNKHQLAGISNNKLWYYDELMTKDDYPISYTFDFNIELICKGSEALERFPDIKERIESQGYYWGVNPLGKLISCCSGHGCGCMGMPINVSSQKEIDDILEIEEKTFTLEQTLIFKIVE